MKYKNAENHRDIEKGSCPLVCAEQLSVATILENTPLDDRQTWGELECSLSTNDAERLSIAFYNFGEKLIVSTDAETQLVSAYVCALEDLYRERMDGQELSIRSCQEASSRLADILAVIAVNIRDSAKYESLRFEIDIVRELLAHGIPAFPASPREESSRKNPELNHDAYIFIPSKVGRPPRKIPISAKLGGSNATRYAGGLRHVSKKKAGDDLWTHIRSRVPELNQCDMQKRIEAADRLTSVAA